MVMESSISPRRGLSIAAVVLGVASFVLALLTVALFAVPEFGMALLVTTPLGAGSAIVLGGVGVVLASVALMRTASKTLALAGLLTSVLGIIVGIVGFVSVFGGGVPS